eukprot:2844180-Pyramimonas_sp.AAC.1
MSGQHSPRVQGPSYVDDLVTLVDVGRFDRWAQAFDDSTLAFYEAAVERGLTPNFKRGNTEAMFIFLRAGRAPREPTFSSMRACVPHTP